MPHAGRGGPARTRTASIFSGSRTSPLWVRMLSSEQLAQRRVAALEHRRARRHAEKSAGPRSPMVWSGSIPSAKRAGSSTTWRNGWSLGAAPPSGSSASPCRPKGWSARGRARARAARRRSAAATQLPVDDRGRGGRRAARSRAEQLLDGSLRPRGTRAQSPARAGRSLARELEAVPRQADLEGGIDLRRAPAEQLVQRELARGRGARSASRRAGT